VGYRRAVAALKMTRMLEARRVVVQETEPSTLSPSRPPQPPQHRMQLSGTTESRKRKILNGLDGNDSVELVQFSEIFGRDRLEESVVSPRVALVESVAIPTVRVDVVYA
jgi:hypothetical protein